MTITASTVKELRDRTGAGMMDCKRALTETSGDMEQAVDLLRQKGAASAAKRAGRETNEGAVISYIHPGSRLGVLIELNCETDFVARTDDFQRLAKSLAMQVAACNPLVVRREELAQDAVDREREIYAQQARETGKPEAVIEKIIDGKMDKWYREICLLEQIDVRDPSGGVTVEALVTDAAAKLGENLSVRRFSRFALGE
ncbi:MAG: translation elongation factor Ts [Gemmatimonadetes bacterium]|nr:translation elongation factor Ts [Gemmatimonadota bacterium]